MPNHDPSRPLEGAERILDRPDGTRLFTVARGEGPTVVLAHGYGMDHHEWNVVAELLDDHRIIAFDLRGHGRSQSGSDGVDTAAMTEDYVAVLEAYDVRDAVLAGHSTGGFLAIRFLLDHADVAAERLVGCGLIATFAGDVNRDNPQNRFQLPLIKSGLLIRMLGFGPIARAFVRSLAGRPFDRAWVAPFVDVFRATDHMALIPLLHALVSENHYGRLGDVDMPCTIVVGSRDPTTPPFHTDDLHAGIRDSRLVRVPDKGHLLNWEAPEVLAREIRALGRSGEA